MLTTAYRHDGPTAVRYPRGSGTGRARCGTDHATDRQSRSVSRDGRRVALSFSAPCCRPRSKPVRRWTQASSHAFHQTAGPPHAARRRSKPRITGYAWEENAVLAAPARKSPARWKKWALQGPPGTCAWACRIRFVDHGDQGQLLTEIGLTPEQIVPAGVRTARNDRRKSQKLSRQR